MCRWLMMTMQGRCWVKRAIEFIWEKNTRETTKRNWKTKSNEQRAEKREEENVERETKETNLSFSRSKIENGEYDGISYVNSHMNLNIVLYSFWSWSEWGRRLLGSKERGKRTAYALELRWWCWTKPKNKLLHRLKTGWVTMPYIYIYWWGGVAVEDHDLC